MLTIGWIKSTIDLNLGKLHKDRRNAILEVLEDEFPAGKSFTFTLPTSLTLPLGWVGETRGRLGDCGSTSSAAFLFFPPLI